MQKYPFFNNFLNSFQPVQEISVLLLACVKQPTAFKSHQFCKKSNWEGFTVY